MSIIFCSKHPSMSRADFCGLFRLMTTCNLPWPIATTLALIWPVGMLKLGNAIAFHAHKLVSRFMTMFYTFFCHLFSARLAISPSSDWIRFLCLLLFKLSWMNYSFCWEPEFCTESLPIYLPTIFSFKVRSSNFWCILIFSQNGTASWMFKTYSRAYLTGRQIPM